MPVTPNGRRDTKPQPRRLAGSSRVAVALLLAGLFPVHALCQALAASDSLDAAAEVRSSRSAPELRTRREITLLGVGTGAFAAYALLPTKSRVVPVQGLDPTEIGWSLDRDVVGNRSVSAGRASDWTLKAVVALPLVVSWATSRPGARWRDFGRSTLVHAETFLISLGITRVAKSALGRPRPYAYLSAGSRPDNATYDVGKDRTFRSMWSGHSATAWTGAALGVTEYLLQRPDAGPVERVGIGFLSGALAGGTSTLRVEAGQHFPSDVILGAGLGVLAGVTIPLLHRGERASPTSAAWLQAVGGVVAGTVLGVVVARTY